uniref:Rho-GAP domain-containing protein n=1 Tax=Clastoptera arizonana TaxID=38151 RepID=A0A1B6DNC9_9HEMI
MIRMKYFKTHRRSMKKKPKEHPIFGVPLAVAVERNRCHDGVEIPVVVRDCIDLVQEIGLNVEGIYKVSGIKSRVQIVRRLYNLRETVLLADYDLPVATSLLKLFLRELPEPILTNDLVSRFEEAAAIKDVSTREAEMKFLIEKLPKCNYVLLAWVVKHLDNVSSHEKYNKMNAQTLAITLSPVFHMSQRLLSALLCHCDTIFPGLKLTKYIPPLSCGSPSLPDSISGITEELRKQESLLEQIHCEMNAGLVTKNREEQLWEVQRFITQLKRKLRSLDRAVETNQRSFEETDSAKPEDDLNLHLQQPTTSEIPLLSQHTKHSEHIVEVVIEREDSEPASDKLKEIQVFERPVEDQKTSRKEELALCLETEELTSMVTSLQAMIEYEKVEINRLKNQIQALGGHKVQNGFIEEDVFTEMKSDDTLLLLFQKENLIQNIIEEREACANLRVKIKLAQMSLS